MAHLAADGYRVARAGRGAGAAAGRGSDRRARRRSRSTTASPTSPSTRCRCSSATASARPCSSPPASPTGVPRSPGTSASRRCSGGTTSSRSTGRARCASRRTRSRTRACSRSTTRSPREEIAASRRELESRLGRPVTRRSPTRPALFGERERRLVAEAGYTAAVSCEPGREPARRRPLRAAPAADRRARPARRLQGQGRRRARHAAAAPRHVPPPALRHGREAPRRSSSRA